MKKVIIVILVILIAVAGGFGLYVYFHTATALDDTNKQGLHEVGENETYTRSNFVFNRMDTKEEIYYSTMNTLETKTYTLCASMVDQVYLPVELPSDRSYTNIFGYDIYADDGSIEVHIKPGNKGTVASPVEHGESITSNIAATKSGGKYKHSVVKYMDDKYVIEAHVYSNTRDWSLVRDSVIDADFQTKYSDFLDADFISARELRENESDKIQSIILNYNADADVTFFADGYIQELQLAYDIEKSKDIVKTYLYNVVDIPTSNATACNMLETGAAYYELGDMAAACIPTKNDNYSIVVVGSGDEAKLNMKQIVVNYKKDK